MSNEPLLEKFIEVYNDVVVFWSPTQWPIYFNVLKFPFVFWPRFKIYIERCTYDVKLMKHTSEYYEIYYWLHIHLSTHILLLLRTTDKNPTSFRFILVHPKLLKICTCHKMLFIMFVTSIRWNIGQKNPHTASSLLVLIN